MTNRVLHLLTEWPSDFDTDELRAAQVRVAAEPRQFDAGTIELAELTPSTSGWAETSVHVDATAFRHKGDPHGSHIEVVLRHAFDDEQRPRVELDITGAGVNTDNPLSVTTPSALDALIEALLGLRQRVTTQRILNEYGKYLDARAPEQSPGVEDDNDDDDKDDDGDAWKKGAPR